MAVRFLAVADIHSRAAAIRAVRVAVERHQPDAVIVAGDLTNYGDAAEIRCVVDSIPGRVLAIPGNLDVPQAFEAGISQSRAKSLVGTSLEVHGIRVAGPGSQPHGAATPCDILVVHEPPRGILDDVGGGRRIGRVEHLELLNRLRPRVLLCGHCHENPGVAAQGSTTVVNCTLGRGGRGALIEIEGERVAARLL
jgi:hypothetical protein